MTFEQLRAAMPTGAGQWWVAARLAAGALVGWLFYPVLWVVVGPRAWVVLILARASQESAYNPNAVGTQAEVGPLQFSQVGVQEVGWPLTLDLPGEAFDVQDWRRSPFWSAVAAARHTLVRLRTGARFWLLAVPVYRLAVFQRSWTHTPGSDLKDAWTDATAEARYYPAWWAWTLVSYAPILVCLALLLNRRAARR